MGVFNVITNFISIKSRSRNKGGLFGLGANIAFIGHNLSEITEDARLEIAKSVKRRLVNSINTGGVKGIGNFEPNSPITTKLKSSSQPLIWTGEFRDSIEVIQKNKDTFHIGLPPGAIRRNGPSQGDSLNKIGWSLELGSKKHNIPPRPLFRWTVASLMKDKKFKENVNIAIKKPILKKISE